MGDYLYPISIGGSNMKNIFGVCFLLMALAVAILLITEPPLGLSGNAYADPSKGKKCAACHTTAKKNKGFTDSFRLEDCNGFSTTGENTYFVLNIGHQLILEGIEGKGKKKAPISVTSTVLDTIKTVNIDIGGIPTAVETRVVEEVETANGVLAEISRNYFAICNKTNTVFYFGEAVDIYDGNGVIIDHAGSWEAGVDGAMPGIQMPGIILLGGKYFQEVAPNKAMDRAELVSISEEVVTPAGTFQNCLKTMETSPLEKGGYTKYYAPGIGLINDGTLNLKQYTH
jgi:hypothetical protein